MIVQEKEVKSLLSKSNLPIAAKTANPSLGCPQACTYCHDEFLKRFTGHTESRGQFLLVPPTIGEFCRILLHIDCIHQSLNL